MTHQFRAPSVIVNAPGAAREVGSFAKNVGSKALIVTDALLRKLGLLNDIETSLQASGIPFAFYDKVVTEPTMDHVEEGFGVYRECDADFLVSVGGGSSIDVAKGISALATNLGKIRDFEGTDKIPSPGAPLVAIPTTAGTGSEVTQVTIITDTTRQVKMRIASPNIMPRVCLDDSMMTIQMPQQITAATGLDALTHAIEAYVSLKAQPITDALALHAIRLISANLRQAWSNGSNLEARTNMMTAALEAGLAFSNASVALVHGMARPIGAYFHVPHGISIAALLPTVIEFSIPGNPRRYADIAEAMGEVTSGLSVLDAARLATKAAKQLNEDLRISQFRALEIDEAKFNSVLKHMAADAIASGSPANNPRKASEEDIVELYRKAY